jgi:hypothetical protein
LIVLTTAERYVDRLDDAAHDVAAAVAVEELRCAGTRCFDQFSIPAPPGQRKTTFVSDHWGSWASR